ncbi:MAG: excinuclease ABC subunit UvrA [Parachlamydiales bacterium]
MSKGFACSFSCGLSAAPDPAKIIVHGAREHHLKNICFEIPKGKLVALTGPSGSGKSSIAVEVLQKECLRQFLESLGMTTDHLAKAKVDHIMGLSPSIGVSQRATDFNPRSTVGTKTGILTILRNLFASMGRQPCSGCGKFVKQPMHGKDKLTTIEIEESSSTKKRTKIYFDCPHCGGQLEKLKMAHFSSNAAAGACDACKGAGELIGVDIPKLLNEDKTIRNGGVSFWDEGVAKHYEGVIVAASKHYQFSFDPSLPIRNYTQEQRNFLLYGVSFPEFVKAHQNIKEPKKVGDGKFEGLVPYLLNRYKSNPHKLPHAIKNCISHEPCLACSNARLGKIGREATVQGKTIHEVAGLNLRALFAWVEALDHHVSEEELQVLAALSSALKERISNVIEVGLDYLTLDRSLPTLSAGESQRLKLACVLGSGLTGVLYVLDEPTTGLHPHDTAKLIKTLRNIQKAGNTVLIIEHDPDVIKMVDHIIDIGPGGGRKGGEIVVAGTPNQVEACAASITGKYLARKAPGLLDRPRPQEGKVLTVRGASEHNLKGIDVSIPVNQFTVLTGVSGSGKSTFLFNILDKAARKHFYNASEMPGKHVSIQGLNHFNRVVTVDQATIRSTQSSRSNVATYTKLFDLVRDLFASLPEARARGFGADKFSFNASDERCENCKGAGTVAIDMAFMPDVEMQCPVCDGMRFNEEILSVKFQGHHIAAVLEMTVSDAAAIFNGHQNIFALLDLMKQVGLDYLTLGQSTSTLSGGEAQRIKLAAELSKSGTESTLYLLDEPTTGLHAHEVEKLLHILRKLVSRGNTVIVIEHHLDAICEADTLIDFGPVGGDAGGEIMAIGSPLEVAANASSLTGQCLKAYLKCGYSKKVQ